MASFAGEFVAGKDEDVGCKDSLNTAISNARDCKLSPTDAGKLQSCIKSIQDVACNTASKITLRKCHPEFNLETALETVLFDEASPAKTTASEITLRTYHHDLNWETALEAVLLYEAPIIELTASELSPVVEVINEPNENHSFGVLSEKSTCTKVGEVIISNINVGEKSSQKPTKSKTSAAYIYKKERNNEKCVLNLVVVGHVDAGKSTLMGHLLYRLGQVSKRTMHKFEQDSRKLGKSSFMYAWVLDETAEERNRGVTMDVAQSKFETTRKSIVLLDAPGHKDFIPSMITGASQADVAVLVVDSTRGEFETGFEAGGQTREHTMLIRSLGVSEIVVAVNKMDNVNWSKDRFDEIRLKIVSFLKTVGFKEGGVVFVPCSGLTGENLTSCPEIPELRKWYRGSTLVDAIDNFHPPERPIGKSLRMCVSDIFKGTTGGFCLAGKIGSGFIKTGDKVLILPAGEQGFVKGITIDGNPVQHGFAGDQIIIQVIGIDMNNVYIGSIACDTEKPVKIASRFEARLIIFNTVIPITKGFPVILHCQSICEQAVIKNIISQLNPSTGEVIKKKPRCLAKNSSAVVEIEVSRPICIELYKDFKDFGRFMLRYSGSTIAAGLVIRLK